MRGTLQQLVCTGPLPSLQHLLVGGDAAAAAPWPRLLHLACDTSGVARMDASLALLPAVRTALPPLPLQPELNLGFLPSGCHTTLSALPPPRGADILNGLRR